MLKDLSAHQIGNLSLSLSGRTFIVRPPGAAEGVLLMKIVTIGWQAAFNSDNLSESVFLEQIPAETLEKIAADDFGVERLALGEDVLQEMIDAKVPAKDITMAARYAAFFWVFDEASADKMMATDLAIKRGEQLPTPTHTTLPKL